MNQDGEVNILDLIQVAQSLNTDAATNPQADVNGDGTIDVLDLIVVAQRFGESTAAAPASVTIDGEKLTPATVQSMDKSSRNSR